MATTRSRRKARQIKKLVQEQLVTESPQFAPPESELLIFVPMPPKSSRTLVGKIVERSVAIPNPILPDYDLDDEEAS